MELSSEEALLSHDVPLAGLTTFRIGGPAHTMVRPRSVSGLETCLKFFEKAGIHPLCLGRGSNLLVNDSGVETVLSFSCLDCIEIDEGRQNVTVTAGAGAGLRGLVALTARLGLHGLEPFSGIPASIGGALFMNAGAGGASFCDIAEEVLLVSSNGSGWISAGELHSSYRSGGVPDGAVVAAVKFVFERGDSESVRERVSKIMKRRATTQPIGAATAGCVFRNFSDAPAGLLIDRCGLKGVRSGDAMVSTVHANFIVNTGRAVCSDVLRLIDMVRERVSKETGRELQLEIRVV